MIQLMSGGKTFYSIHRVYIFILLYIAKVQKIMEASLTAEEILKCLSWYFN